MIPYGHHEINEDDIAAVVQVLRSDFLTQGPGVPAFEKAIADYCGVGHAVAVNSATSALHVACLALGVGPGDVVWTSPITFVASANCAMFCGAQVDFVDIDARTYNMSPDRLAEKLVAAEKADRLPKVVIPVHLCGQSCDMAAIHELGRRYGFRIIEDASQAVGGRYRGEPIGNCRYSDISVFSFHPVKIITTTEGGVALTNDAGLAKHMQLVRTHGITREDELLVREPDGPWYYEQVELGFNYRMTDVQARLGLSQMRRLDEFVERRHAIAGRYDELLAEFPVVLPWQHPDCYSGLHIYVVRVKPDGARTRRRVFESMRRQGIGVQVHYIPVYWQPFYERQGFRRGLCPAAEEYYAETVTLPIFSQLNEVQQDQITAALRRSLIS